MVLDDSRKILEDEIKIIRELENKDHIIVINKIDENKRNINLKGIRVSAINKEVDELKKAIKDKVGFDINYKDKPMLTNIRQTGLMMQALENLKSSMDEINKGMPIDLCSVGITEALKNIDEIVGNRAKTNFIDEIFSRFCLGK